MVTDFAKSDTWHPVLRGEQRHIFVREIWKLKKAHVPQVWIGELGSRLGLLTFGFGLASQEAVA